VFACHFLGEHCNTVEMEGQRLPRKTPAQQMLMHHMSQLNSVLKSSSTQPFGADSAESSNSPGGADPASLAGSVNNPDSLLNSRKIQDLLTAIDPTEKADPVVEELLLQIAEEFITSVATCSCQLAKHRGAQTLDVADIQLHLGEINSFVVFV
jgi:histone H3/H4